MSGMLLGNPLTLTSTNGQWLRHTVPWALGGSTTATFGVVDLNLTAANSDFALDDIAPATCP